MAVEIGKVAVRVYPDTKGFGAETKRKLDKIKDIEFEVPVVPDENMLKAKLEALAAKMNREMAKPKNWIKYKAVLELTDAEAMKQAKGVAKKYQHYADLHKVHFKSELDQENPHDPGDSTRTVHVRVDRDTLEDSLNDILGDSHGREKIKVDVDKKAMGKDLDDIARRFRQDFANLFKGKKLKTKLEVETQGIENATKRTEELEKAYREAADAVRANDIELSRVVDNYDQIDKQVKRYQKRLEQISSTNEDQAAEYATITREVMKLSRTLKGFADERKQLEERGKSLRIDLEISDSSVKKAKSRLSEIEEKAKETARNLERGPLRDISNEIAKVFSKRRAKMQLEIDTSKLRDARANLNEVAKAWDEVDEKVAENIESQRKLRLEFDWNTAMVERYQRLIEKASSGHIISKKNARQIENYNKRIEYLQQKLSEIHRDSERFARKNVSLIGDVKIKDKDLETAESQIQAFRDRIREHKAQIEVEVDKDSIVRASGQLALLARTRFANIIANVKTKATGFAEQNKLWKNIAKNSSTAADGAKRYFYQMTGARLLVKTTQEFWEIVPKLDMAIPQIAKMIGGITPLAAGAVAGVGSLVNIAADSAKAFQLILAAPAALALVGGAGFVLVQAFKDINNHLPQVVEDFKQLKSTVSDNFWKTGAEPIGKMFEQVFKVTDKYAPQFAQAVGTMTGGLAKGFGDAFEKQGPRFFENATKMFENMSTGMESLGSALGNLIGAGSDSFESFATWFNEVTGKFDEWVKTNDANGNITKWIQEGADALSDLGGILVDTIGIVGNFAEAFDKAGFPGLSEFADGMSKVKDATDGIANNKAFMGVLTSARDMLVEIGNTVGPLLGPAFTQLADLVTHTFDTLSTPISGALESIIKGFMNPKFQDGIKGFVDGIGSFLTDIKPGLERFVTEFGGLLGVVGDAAESWGPAFNDLLNIVSNVGANLHPGIESFLEFIGPELQQAIGAIGPVVEDLATKLSDFLSNEGFQNFLSDVNDKLQVVIPAIGAFVGWIIDLGTWLFDKYNAAPEWLQDVISSLALAGGAGLGIGKLLGFLKPLLGLLAKPIKNMAINGLMKGLDLLGKFKLPKVGSIVGRITTWLAGIFPKGAFKGLLRSAFTKFLGPISIALLLAELIKPLDVANLADGIVDALGLEDTFIGKFTESLKTKVDEMFGDKSLLDIIIDNFKSAFEKFGDGDIAGGLIDLAKGLFSGFNFVEVVADATLEALGLNGGQIAAGKASLGAAFDEGGISGLFTKIWDDLKKLLSDGWNIFKGKLDEWLPGDGGFVGFGVWLWGKIKEIFGFGKGGDAPAGGATSMSAQSLGMDTSYFEGIGDKILGFLDDGWQALKDRVMGWKPVQAAWKFITTIIDAVKSLFQDSDGDGVVNALDADYWIGIWNKVKTWLSEKWDELKGNITDWKPVATVLNFAEKVWAWVKTLLGIAGGDADKDGTINILDGDWWGGVWTSVKTWFSDKWEELKTNITEWEPVATAIDLASKVVDWVKDLLGLGEGGFTGTFDFDFTDLWNDKIKPALTTALAALGALILAPAAIVLAPVIVPAVIIGWLLGKDGEGNWSFQELTDKISGAWEKIKGGISAGIDLIKGFLETLVFTPIEMGAKLTKWLFGDNPFSGIGDTVSTTISNASGAFNDGITRGVQFIKDNTPKSLPGTGLVAGLLGVDEPGKARITGGLNFTKDNFNVFGLDLTKVANGARTGVSGEFEGMKGEATGSLSGLSTDGSAKMESLRSAIAEKMAAARTAARDRAQEARDAVVNRMQSMKTDGGNNVEGLRSAVQNKTADMKNKGGSNIESLRSTVVQKLTDMKRGGGDQFEGLRSTASSKGQSTRNDYVDKMQSLNRDSAQKLRDFADAAKKILAIDASKAGTSTGNTYKSGLSSALSAAKTLASSMASGVKSNLKIDAYSSGSSIGSTFASGIRSKVSAVASAASALASAARKKLPNSPAKEGPFSGSGWGGWGESIGDELAKGLEKAAPTVAKEAEKMMTGVSDALGVREGLEVKSDFTASRRKFSLESDQADTNTGGQVINVNVESKADDALTEGVRFGRDISFAMKGAGF